MRSSTLLLFFLIPSLAIGCRSGSEEETPTPSRPTAGSAENAPRGGASNVGSGPMVGAGRSAGESGAGGVSGRNTIGAGGSTIRGGAGGGRGDVTAHAASSAPGGSATAGSSSNAGGPTVEVGGANEPGGALGAGASGMASGCVAVPACDRPAPEVGPAQPWRHLTTSVLTAITQGEPRHRGRDLLLAPGDEQWVLGKFAYGLADSALVDEAVDLYLLRNCAGDWEFLGTTYTTDSGDHTAVEGVGDTGGRVYFRIPDPPLGVGRHRIHMVVRGDLSRAEQFIEVIDPSTPLFVSDVDGTLTTQETEEYLSFLSGTMSEANANAAQALTLLARKGIRPLYLTARPDWLDARTR